MFFQAEDGIRDLVRSRGLGDVYKRQEYMSEVYTGMLGESVKAIDQLLLVVNAFTTQMTDCLLYTSDAADDLLCVDLGGRRIIQKKKTAQLNIRHRPLTFHHNCTHHTTTATPSLPPPSTPV